MIRKYLVIITAENKEKYILKTIESCLKQNSLENLRLIVTYTKLKNEFLLKKKFMNQKKIIFFKLPIKKNIPVHDQLYKIEQANKLAQHEWILLLDGDDLFTKDKKEYLDKLKLNKQKIYLNYHKILRNDSENLLPKKKFYKKMIIYRKLFNDWPENINTSSIIIHSSKLKNFYKSKKPYNWKYLAIDIQLVLVAHYSSKLINIKKILTLKREGINNIDKNYSNIFKKIYWLRRYEQHNLTNNLSGKLNYFDRFLTSILMKLIK